MLKTYGFVYLWMDTKKRRFYIGSHWGDIDDGYICSSSWMLRAYKKRPNTFKRRILSTVYDRNDLRKEEYRWLSFIKPEELKGKRYYNFHNFEPIHWSTIENDRLTISQKISKSKMGIPRTDNFKVKIQEYHKKQAIVKYNLTEEEWNALKEKRLDIKIKNENRIKQKLSLLKNSDIFYIEHAPSKSSSKINAYPIGVPKGY